MNERMSDLLDLASQDDDAPLGFNGDVVVRRARARRRRRQGGAAMGLTAAAVAGLVVVTQMAGPSGSDTKGPAVAPSSTAPQPSSSPTATPALDPQEQSIVDRCARVSLPPSDATVSNPPPGADANPGRVTSVVPTEQDAGFLHTWTLDAHVEDAQGVTATFVNPEHTRWASCQLADGGTDTGDEVDTQGGLPDGPIPQSWYGPDGYRHQATSPAWSQVCSPGEGKICARELFAGAFARYAGVESARVDAPDGTVLTPDFGHYTYVFRHTEQRVDPNRASNDNQPLPSMPVTLLDDQGRQIIRYDYYPSYIIPSSCPSTGGC